MSKMCLVLSTNNAHAELTRARARRLLDGELLKVFKAISKIPCSVSVEGIDVELFSVVQYFVKNSGLAEVISGEFVHAMPDLVFEANPELARLNLTLGDAIVKHPVRFVTEYCSYPEKLARQVVAANGPCACYLIDNVTSIYSDNWGGEVPPPVSHLADDVSAVRNAGVTYLRMRSKYFSPILTQWFAFQRYRCAEGEKKKSAADVVNEMENQLEAAEHDHAPVVFIPIDIESCVIGSHHGAVIYEEIVAELLDRKLPLIGPRKAFEILAPLAKETERPQRALPNMKWTGHNKQAMLKRMVLALGWAKIPQSLVLRKLALMPFISDGFVVCKYAIDPRVNLDADLGPLTFGGEYQDILTVQTAALCHFTRGENFRETMAKLAKLNPDSYLFSAMMFWAENNRI